MIPPGGAKRFEAANFGFNVVGLQVKMHAFFGDLFVAGLLEKDSYLRVRDTQVCGICGGYFQAEVLRQR